MSAVVVRSARVDDEAALAALWAMAFTPPLLPAQWLIDAERHAHTLVAEDDGGICGSILGLPKRLREADGGVADVHAIGSVAVADRARGRGLARRLVAASLEAGRDADWALLFTGTPEVYRSSGFETFEMARVLSGPWASPSAPGAARAATVVASTVAAGTLGPVRELYQRSRDGRVVLAPVRDERDWAMAEVRMQGATLYLHTGGAAAGPATGAAVRGYAIAETRGSLGVLLESAVLPEAADRDDVHRELLAAVAGDWTAAGVDRCELAVPAVPDEEAAVRDVAPDAVRQLDRTGMTRPLRRDPRLHGIRHFTAGDYF